MVTPGTLSIGAAARATELSVKAIRHYEEIGLIPKVGRSNGGMHASGQRLYTAAEVARLRFIRRARLLGLPLADIRQLLAAAAGHGCPSQQPEYQQILENHLREINERIQHLQELRAELVEMTTLKRRSTADAGLTSESCGCLQTGAVHSPEKLQRQQSNACECGCCRTVHADSRRAPTGKVLNVTIVERSP